MATTKTKLFEQSTNLLQTYLRNQLLLGTTMEQLPAMIVLNDEFHEITMTREADNLFNSFTWGTRNVVEVISLYLLHNLRVRNGNDSLTLYEGIRSGQGANLYDWLVNVLTTQPKLISEMVEISVRTNKNVLGISGSCLYLPASERKCDWYALLRECIDHIFGRDALGIAIDKFLDNTFCPNVIDILPAARFSTLLNTISAMSRKPTNMYNYFASRGMAYLDQTVFLRRGVVCGCANISYVTQTAQGIPDLITRKNVTAESAANEYRDMVVLSATTLKSKGMFGYFVPSKFEQFLGATGFRVERLTPNALQEFCGISYSFGG